MVSLKTYLVSALFLMSAKALCVPFEVTERAINGAYAPPTSTQERLVIITPGVDKWTETLGVKIAFPYSETLHLPDTSEDALLQSIIKYAQDHGTLDELVIDAHGASNAFSPRGDEEGAIDARKFLKNLAETQEKLGIKVADRIVIFTCNEFTNLTPEDVAEYRSLSRILNAEIAAPTNFAYGGLNWSARMAVFMPDGKITRDKLDIPIDARSAIGSGLSNLSGYSSIWFGDAQKGTLFIQEAPDKPAVISASEARRPNPS